MSKVVAIVGRPNVGKSTLFNRLTGSRKAIVDNSSGVTRDRHYGTAEWRNRSFTIIDTGGYVLNSKDVFESAIRDQVDIAIQEAHLLLFMVDVTTGITDLDDSFARLLRQTKKPVLLVVNKVDNNERLMETAEFYSFGIEPMFNLASISGSGTGELLDEIYERLELEKEAPAFEDEVEEDEFEMEETLEEEEGYSTDFENDDEEEEDWDEAWEAELEEDFFEEEFEDAEEEEKPQLERPKIAIVGRPNVGKSSLVNALLGEDRNIVTPVAGTTRDTIHSVYKAFGKEMLLVDTAGIRKKGKVKENIEFYSVMRSIKAIEDSDICVIMIDATLGLEGQDMNLLHLAQKNGKGIIILVNKWDLIEKSTNTAKEYEKTIREKTSPFTDYPIIFISVEEKQRVFKAIEEIEKVHQNLHRRIPTRKLNDFILPVIQRNPPPAIKGKYIRVKYVTQLKSRNVSFVFFCNLPQYIKEPYRRFLENKLRESLDFKGVPIRLFFRKK